MFNIPNFPQLNLRPTVIIEDNRIIITNWIGGKECQIKLNLEKYNWEVSECQITAMDRVKTYILTYALYNMYGVIGQVGVNLLVYKEPDINIISNRSKQERGRSEGIRKWLLKRASSSIAKRVASAMKLIIAQYASPDMILLHKSFLSTFGIKKYNMIASSKLTVSFIKENPFFINDLRFGYKAALLWFVVSNYEKPDKAEHWIQMYLPKKEKPYTTLAKTLLKCKKINYEQLKRVCLRCKLPKIFENSLELNIWAKYQLLDHNSFGRLWASEKYNKVRNINCIEKSSHQQIFKAKSLLEKHLQQKLDFRKKIDIDNFVSFLYDYPIEEKCEIVTLMERSIQWHIEERQKQIQRSIAEIKENTEKLTIKPPIPLPIGPSIEFLANCQSILDEGIRLSHCIGSYARQAFTGNCYLFHIDWKGHMASAEVWKDGTLSQIHGPYNKDKGNKAVIYGRKKLGAWCSELKKYLAENSAKTSKQQLKGELAIEYMENLGYRHNQQEREELLEIPF